MSLEEAELVELEDELERLGPKGWAQGTWFETGNLPW